MALALVWKYWPQNLMLCLDSAKHDDYSFELSTSSTEQIINCDSGGGESKRLFGPSCDEIYVLQFRVPSWSGNLKRPFAVRENENFGKVCWKSQIKKLFETKSGNHELPCSDVLPLSLASRCTWYLKDLILHCCLQCRYHVVFFDDPVSRVWAELGEIKSFQKKDIEQMMVSVSSLSLDNAFPFSETTVELSAMVPGQKQKSENVNQ